MPDSPAAPENGSTELSAVLFGSIGAIADTSEIQREAFNEAFTEHGLDWSWDRDTYLAMLEQSGGKDRIAGYANSVGEKVDAKAIHNTKSEIFQRKLAGSGIEPREGVADTVREAKGKGVKVALVTTTSPANVSALMEALDPALEASDFDLVVDSSDVFEPKPAPAAYRFALTDLGAEAGDCVAIEDNLGGVQAASAAGVACVAFPNQNTAGHEFELADRRVERVDLGELEGLAAGR